MKITKTKLGMIFLLIMIMVPLTGYLSTENLGDTEWGVPVSYLPQIKVPYYSFENKALQWKKFGGGFGELRDPGSMVIYNHYWTKLEKVDIKDKILSFTIRGKGDYADVNDAVDCRDIHGNRFLIAPTFTWRLTPQGITNALEYVGVEQIKKDGLELAVKRWCRSKIFATFSNLSFKEVPDSDKRSAKAKKAMELANEQLKKFGIEIVSVKLQDHIFRQEFQDVIDQTKKADEATLGIANKIKARDSYWKTQFQEAKGSANEAIESAKGKKQGMVYQGDANYVKLHNEALGIKADTEAIVALEAGRANALSGENGAVVAELEVLDTWEKSGANFFVMPENSGGGDLKMYDMNAFYRDMGKMSLMGKSPVEKKTADLDLPAVGENKGIVSPQVASAPTVKITEKISQTVTQETEKEVETPDPANTEAQKDSKVFKDAWQVK